MPDSRVENRIFIRIFAVSIAVILLLILTYELFGESLIKQHFDGHTIAGIIKCRTPDGMSLQEFADRTAASFWQNVVLGIPLSLLFIFLLYKAYKRLFGLVPTGGVILKSFESTLPRYAVLSAGLLYTLWTLLIFYPSLRSFGSAMIGPPEDNMACFWTLSWWQDHVLHGTGSLTFVNDIFFPEGSSFYYHAWSFYSLAAFSLLRLAFEPVAAYNLLILHTFVCAGLGSYLLARYLLKNHWLALLAGFLFAFNPAHFIRAEHHLNIATIQFIPLFGLFFIRSVRGESRWSVFLAAVFLLLNALVDWNYLLYGIMFILFAYAYLTVRRHRLWLPDTAAKSGIIIGGALLASSPWLAPMIWVSLKGASFGPIGHNMFVTDLLAFLVPSPSHTLGTVESAC